jgi:hypothetical protein
MFVYTRPGHKPRDMAGRHAGTCCRSSEMARWPALSATCCRDRATGQSECRRGRKKNSAMEKSTPGGQKQPVLFLEAVIPWDHAGAEFVDHERLVTRRRRISIRSRARRVSLNRTSLPTYCMFNFDFSRMIRFFCGAKQLSKQTGFFHCKRDGVVRRSSIDRLNFVFARWQIV